jgi:hypothetical protein
MQTQVRQLRYFPDLAPGLLQVDQVPALTLARHYKGLPSRRGRVVRSLLAATFR